MERTGRTINASLWALSGKLLSRLFDFALLLVFSRLLTPEDFGLVALAMAPVYIGEALLELPLVQALLRLRNPAAHLYDTAFTLSVLRGLVLALIFLALAGPLSQFYNDPRLTPLIYALALAPILRGTISPRMVIFMRDLNFRKEFALDVGGKLAAFVVALWIAISTQSYWAIAAATIIAPLTMNVMSYIIAPYRPQLTLAGWAHFADMIGWNSASQVIKASNWQVARILLGRFVPTDALGRYSISDDLLAIPVRSVIVPLARPLMANFSLQENPANLARAFGLAQSAITGIMTPIFVAICLLAEPIVFVVFGDKWMGAAPILQWLAVSAIIALPVAPLTPLALSLDKTRFETLRAATEFAVKMPAMFIGVVYFGIEGALVAVGLGAVASLMAAVFIIQHLTALSVIQQARAFMRPWLSGLVMAGTIWLTRPDVPADLDVSKFLILIFGLASGALGLAVYGLSLAALWRLAGRPYGAERTVIDLVRAKLSRS